MCRGSVTYSVNGGVTFSESSARLSWLSKFTSLRLKFGVSALAMLFAITLRRRVVTSISLVRSSRFLPNAPPKADCAPPKAGFCARKCHRALLLILIFGLFSTLLNICFL